MIDLLIKAAYAQGEIAIMSPVPSPTVGFTNLANVIAGVARILFIIAAITCFVYLILGGLQWITAGGDSKKTETAGKQITNALVGIGIVAAAWALMVVVQKITGINLNNISVLNMRQ